MSFDELPEVLTVEEAGAFLRIGRGLAYDLARRYVATNGADGLPVVRLGRRLVVPKRQLQRLLLDGGAAPAAAVVVDDDADRVAGSAPARRHSRRSPDTQLTLLPPDAKQA